MPAVKMNTLWLSKLQFSESRVEYRDEDTRGLWLRVGSNTMTWFFTYRHGARTERIKLGTYPDLGLADARKEAAVLRASIIQGENPAGRLREEKKTPTFADLCNEYLTRHAAHKRTKREDERIITRELLPRWGSIRCDKITRRQVISMLDDIVGRGSPIMANRTLALVRKIFNWALSRDILETTPCLRVKAPGREKTRDRWLSDDEIRAVWEAFEAEPVSGNIFKLLLLTAQRKSEVQGMRWSEIDLEARAWTIPSERAKNRRAHLVPLAPPVVEILKSIPTKGDYVFPSPRPACGCVANLGKALDRIKQLSGVDFHIHDLRRTAATGMARLGVDRLVITKVLNHADRTVTAIYERHGYEAEMRRAIEKWADHVTRLLGRQAGKVLTFPA